jgi:hydroxypyruvate reductase
MSHDVGQYETAVDIFSRSLKAADPLAAVHRAMRVETTSEGPMLILGVAGGTETRLALARFTSILVVGGGKAAVPMLQATEAILGDRLTGGVVVTKYEHRGSAELSGKVRVWEAAHPVPDQQGIEGTKEMLECLRDHANSDTLVLCLLSGGGSALITAPKAGLSLEDLRQVSQVLLRCGAPIDEINAVRSSLDAVKAGGLLRVAGPSTVVSLILSDVIGDPVEVIASGPTTPRPPLYKQSLQILEKYGVEKDVPGVVLSALRDGAAQATAGAQVQGEPSVSQSFIIGSNRLALDMAGERARELGYHTLVLSDRMEGEAQEVAKVYAGLALSLLHSDLPLPKPACILAGGETTVTFPEGAEGGKGGRNQHLALAVAQALHDRLSAAERLELGSQVVVLSGGTDGTDGPTDAAGAVVDAGTVDAGMAKGLLATSFLSRRDSYHFFEGLLNFVLSFFFVI